MPGLDNMKHLNEHPEKPNLLSLEKKDPRLYPMHRSTRNLHTTPSQQKRGTMIALTNTTNNIRIIPACYLYFSTRTVGPNKKCIF